MSSEPSIMPHDQHAQMIQATQTFLDAVEGLLIAFHGAEALQARNEEERRRLTVNLAAQALMQAGAWRVRMVDLNNLALGIGAAVGNISAESSEANSASLVAALIDGYTVGRHEGILARSHFKTSGSAN